MTSGSIAASEAAIRHDPQIATSVMILDRMRAGLLATVRFNHNVVVS
jgi:hypothetical protein